MNFPEFALKKHADTIVDAAKSQFGGILVFVAVIWGVYAADCLPYVEFHRWFALYPKRLSGVMGIVTMPLVHGSFRHIVSNTIPLIIMLITLAALQPKSWKKVVGLVTVVAGSLTWLLGPSTNQNGDVMAIVGASGLVLGLVTFLIAPGVFLIAWWGINRVAKTKQPYPLRIRPVPIVVSAVVGFFCLDNLFLDLVPVFAPLGGAGISYTAHWCGAAAGLFVAYFLAETVSTTETPP